MRLRADLGFAIGRVAPVASGLLAVPVIVWTSLLADVWCLNVELISLFVLLSSIGLNQIDARESHESNNRPTLLKLKVIMAGKVHHVGRDRGGLRDDATLQINVHYPRRQLSQSVTT